MVRKTKEDAQITRNKILAAARDVFAVRGVNRTTLEHIAQAAGVTRGAIYWHFASKSELFYAMRDQVSLPLQDKFDLVLKQGEGDPLLVIERFLLAVLETLSNDEVTRQTFEIMNLKCEYVEEFEPVLQKTISNCSEVVGRLKHVYQLASDAGVLRGGENLNLVALETYVFWSGLARLWLADVNGDVVRKKAGELISAHVNLRRK